MMIVMFSMLQVGNSCVTSSVKSNVASDPSLYFTIAWVPASASGSRSIFR